MHLEYFTIEWILSNIIWFIIIILNHLQFYYHYFIHIQFISFIIANHLLHNHDDPTIKSIHDPIIHFNDINNNPFIIPYYNLTYTITENQPINYFIGQINIDLLKTIKINKSSKLFSILYNSSNKINIFYKLQKSSDYITLNETTSVLVTKNSLI
ncbi:unnamed protein product [Schistosoma mattheei]|uniref:Uncharacterized protein n=1 Tax=Schistosoma mattheei TaxID=31246 RepID=A0AA85BEF8_9TREM|nr:unnamed protein product [Schistosoma mattheei]